ncbi:uncharacterized protein [Malus domestica]|uniref:uncharacterized protein n=1 Tax=Malus domestica TaxID=3750 RepID=UPI0039753558
MSINENGRFPANTQANPKVVNLIDTKFEHAKSVITLRNGKIIDTTPLLEEVEKTKSNDKLDKLKEFENYKEYHVPIPFPKALQPLKKAIYNSDILELFKQVKINIPLLDAIKQVPAYAKFLKDLCAYKRKHNVKKTAFLAAHLADRSIKTPRGVIEDVLVQVDKFYYPIDFIVLDIAPVLDSKNHFPVILGRPFLATCDANISCRSLIMKLCFGNMTLEVNIFNVFRQSHGDDECEVVNFISTAMHGQFERSRIEDDLEIFLLNHDAQNDTKITEIVDVFDSCQVQEVNRWRPKFEELPLLSKVKPSSVEVPKL